MSGVQRFDIRYVTRFRYSSPVRESHNEVRACPADNERQSVLQFRFTVGPEADVQSFRDYWGTRVEAFGVRGLHEELIAVAESSVETRPGSGLPDGLRPLGEVRTSLRLAHFDEVVPTPATQPDGPMLRAVAELGLGEGATAHDAVLAVQDAVRKRLRYERGATTVTTTAAEAWEIGAGVCQDYAHASVALLRALGVPARYVSGFLFTSSDEAGVVPADTNSVEVQTHAWVEAAVAPNRWIAIDPTNGLPVEQFHVKIGHGRHYDDVCPFNGSFVGVGEAELDASVEMRRQGDRDRAPVFVRPADQGVLPTRSPGGSQRLQQQQQQQQ
ncbi:MAG: transglutaminase family protein [Actinomycetota bacterium]